MSTFGVETVRGNIRESFHRVSVVVADAGGVVSARSGDPQLHTILRSAAKPFQAMPVVADGAAERFAISPAELALICASHSSEPEQVENVRGLLARIGCAESDLACGPHRPLWRDLVPRAVLEGSPIGDVPATPLASNCSGKHTGMLALARHHGWETRNYQQLDHPVQQRCREELARWAGMPAAALGTAVDGCGVTCFAMPLERMAVAFARLATSAEPAARTVVSAMTTHPELVAGRGRPCTALMQAFPGQLLAKVGAEGVYGAALLDRGLGLAIKVEDGDGWAAVIALVDVLRQLGYVASPDGRLDRYAQQSIRNTRGETVGTVRPAGRLTLD